MTEMPARDGSSGADVFLSYAAEDRERAREVAGALETRGFFVWWDEHIRAGQAFDDAIESALETARSVVVLWSRVSISSEWVRNEAASAAARGVLVPVLLDKVNPPLEFRRRQYANMVGWDGNAGHPGFLSLCNGIAGLTSGTAYPENVSAARTPAKASRRRRLVAYTAIFGVLCSGAVFAAIVLKQRQQPEGKVVLRTTPLPAAAAPTGAGVLDFPWPGQDCWEILRADKHVTVQCGASRQPLDPGTYTVKPWSDAVFAPFTVRISANSVTTADAGAGLLDVRWPGQDCWLVMRGESEKAALSCGVAQRALQEGTYTIKPMSGGVFSPRTIRIRKHQTVVFP